MDSFSLLRPFIHSLPPETAHNLGLWALRHDLWPSAPLQELPSLHVNALGLTFPNPIGLAAGFDKNAVAIDGLLKLGFGFVEAGTVTPKPQPGNPQPRLFRLVEDRAVINRLGFNNEGLERFVANFTARKLKGIAGANIGKNKDSTDAIADYVTGLKAVYPHADYITVNISSPNTPGLRDLQQHEHLTALLKPLQQSRQECSQKHNRHVPMLLKVAPDLSDQEMEAIAESVLAHGMDGLIVSNTTISRPDSLKSNHRSETGGLSGAPLFALSTQCLKRFYRLTGGKIILVGVGGISSPEQAYAKIRAGATLVQFYTTLVYQGFSAPSRIRTVLAKMLEKDGFSNVQQAVGVDAS
jgi:dihydroorotate dehydrogenase